MGAGEVDLGSLLEKLSSITKDFTVHWAQGIPDMLFHHGLVDVLEQGIAVQQLSAAGSGRAAFANARAATESACDLTIMIAEPADYLQMGAWARAGELLDQLRLAERTREAGIASGARDLVEVGDIAAVAREEAEAWDSHSPGRGALLRDRVDWLLHRHRHPNKRVPSHWSGLSRGDRNARVAAKWKGVSGLAAHLDASYGWQSLHAHPGSRGMLRRSELTPDGRYLVSPKSDDGEDAMDHTRMAVVLALGAAESRPVPTGDAK